MIVHWMKRSRCVFCVDSVIAAWAEAFQLIREIDKWLLFIPLELACGERVPLTADATISKQPGIAWSSGIISLTHVALPIFSDDQLFYQRAPENEEFLFLGQMSI